MSRIGLIRHGSTIWNQEGRTQGSVNIPLCIEGISQANALAERLSKEYWEEIYSSDLLRASQTARIIAEKLGIPKINLDKRLRERNGGLTEGTTEEERIRKWGRNWRELELGIESAEEVMLRGMQCIEEISRTSGKKNILIVSHSALIRASLRKLAPHLPVGEQLEHTSITILNGANQKWECELYNCAIHLRTG